MTKFIYICIQYYNLQKCQTPQILGSVFSWKFSGIQMALLLLNFFTNWELNWNSATSKEFNETSVWQMTKKHLQKWIKNSLKFHFPKKINQICWWCHLWMPKQESYRIIYLLWQLENQMNCFKTRIFYSLNSVVNNGWKKFSRKA